MDHSATYPKLTIRCYASDAQLLVDSDAAYLVQPNAKSRTVDCFYLSDLALEHQEPKLNAPILVACETLKNAAASAAESETAGVFINAQLALPIRHALECLGHQQRQRT